MSQKNERDASARAWFRFVLRAAKWIMFGVMCIAGLNVVLNIVDLLFRLQMGYSDVSLLIGISLMILAGGIWRVTGSILLRL